ncbi:MAG: hypothetical protein V1874_08860 [Spirochaetota bacterium]
MEMLNSRELSICIWIGISFIICIIFFSKIKKSIFDVLKAFFCAKLLIPLLFMTIYIMGCIYGLNYLRLWNTDQIKNTIIWYLTTAVVTYFNSLEIANELHYIRKWIKDNLKVIVFLQFIFNFYTFHIIIEFLSVPIFFIIGGMQGFIQSEKNNKNTKLLKPLNFLIALYVISVIIFTVYSLVTNFNEFAQLKTIYDFVVPIILSLLILPFICILSIFSDYEIAFLNFKHHLKDISLLRFAKIKSLIKFHMKSKNLLRWSSNLFTENISSKSDILTSIENFKKLLLIEKNPPSVSPDKGWSPYSAIKFLDSEGIKTGHYKHSIDDEWFACSPHTEINKGKNFLSNNVSYYVEGSSSIAKKLLLVLDIFELENSKDAVKLFLHLIRILFKKSTEKELPHDFEKAIMNRIDSESVIDAFKIILKKNNTLTNKAYFLEFSIEKI